MVLLFVFSLYIVHAIIALFITVLPLDLFSCVNYMSIFQSNGIYVVMPQRGIKKSQHLNLRQDTC